MFKIKPFIYKNGLKWLKEKRALLFSSGKPDIEVATPPEFGGHRGKWSPEDLFVASVNICILTTFLYYAEKEKLKLLSYESSAEGILEKKERGLIFSTVKIFPKIIVSSKEEIEKTQGLIELSEKRCLISNSIRSKVLIKPKIELDIEKEGR